MSHYSANELPAIKRAYRRHPHSASGAHTQQCGLRNGRGDGDRPSPAPEAQGKRAHDHGKISMRLGTVFLASPPLISAFKELASKFVKEIAGMVQRMVQGVPKFSGRIPGAISCIQFFSNRAPEKPGRQRLSTLKIEHTPAKPPGMPLLVVLLNCLTKKEGTHCWIPSCFIEFETASRTRVPSGGRTRCPCG